MFQPVEWSVIKDEIKHLVEKYLSVMFSKIWERGRGCPRFQSKVVIALSYIEGFFEKRVSG